MKRIESGVLTIEGDLNRLIESLLAGRGQFIGVHNPILSTTEGFDSLGKRRVGVKKSSEPTNGIVMIL